MGVMIIRPDGTTETSDVPSSSEENLNRQIIELPQTQLEEQEEVIQEEIRRRQEKEQAIINRIIGNPLS